MAAELDILEVIRSYRDSPKINGRNQVDEMAGAAVSIVDMIAAVKSNKEGFYDIGRNVCKMVANVIKRSRVPEHPAFTDSKMDALQANLRDIKDRIEKHINRQGLMNMRILRYYFSAKTIRECRNDLQKCYDILRFQYAEETWDNVNALIRHVQELLEYQRQRSLEQTSIVPEASIDESIGEPGPAAEEGNSGVTREGGGSSANHPAVDTINASTSRLPEEVLSLIGGNQTDSTGGDSIRYAQIAGNAVSSTMRTVISVRGSGNRLRITLRA